MSMNCFDRDPKVCTITRDPNAIHRQFTTAAPDTHRHGNSSGLGRPCFSYQPLGRRRWNSVHSRRRSSPRLPDPWFDAGERDRPCLTRRDGASGRPEPARPHRLVVQPSGQRTGHRARGLSGRDRSGNRVPAGKLGNLRRRLGKPSALGTAECPGWSWANKLTPAALWMAVLSPCAAGRPICKSC